MVFRTFSLFVLLLIVRACSYFFLPVSYFLHRFGMYVLGGQAFLVALVFLANMNIFIKNAWFLENVRFLCFLHAFFDLFHYFLILCSCVCSVLGGGAFLVTLDFLTAFIFLAKCVLFLEHAWFSERFLFLCCF